MVLAVGPGSTCLYWNLKAGVDTDPGQASLIIKPLGPVFFLLSYVPIFGLAWPLAPQCPVQSQQANLRRR